MNYASKPPNAVFISQCILVYAVPWESCEVAGLTLCSHGT